MKRKFISALLGALLLFILYILAQLIFGLIQTFLYRPQFAPDDFVLQSEVAFGFIIQVSPIMLIGIYMLVTLILFALLMLKKERREQN
ncbi:MULTISPECIES: hypothetical protein [Solibacillus]|uniref:Uncharacterized protein n=1 Tax=Solibacillus merdavium TaxID=2762218 RepID=A0ABR8XRI9_9BACL|nr:hypothetical protein [Solibacillus merdavium]MBD8034566.1 hypothetical protein [Solibacillus merdavium]